MAFDPSKPFEIERPSFDPSQPFEIESQDAFDPSQPFEVEGKVAFDPSQPFDIEEKEDPSLGRIGAGLSAEIATAQGLKFAGAAAGAAAGGGIASIPLATIGYISGAITGGVAGSVLAQNIEGRDKISQGRVLADTLLNLIPVPIGKLKKGTTFTKALVDNSAKQAAAGAGLSVGAAAIEKSIEEGEFLTPEEILASGGIGAGLGLGLGSLGTVMNKSARKMIGKSEDEITRLYDEGDVDAVNFIDGTIGQKESDRTIRRAKGLVAQLVPSRVIGNRASEDVRRVINEVDAAKETAQRALKTIDPIYNNLSDPMKKRVDDYVEGRIDSLPPELNDIRASIDEAKDLIVGSQNKIIELSEKGFIDLDEGFVQAIKNSAADGSYLRREYRFFEDPKYRPSKQAEEALLRSLTKPLKDNSQMTTGEAMDFIAQLQSARTQSSPLRGLDILGNPKNAKFFKDRNDEMSKEMLDYLGVYKRPGEKIFATISKLGTYASEQSGAQRVARDLMNQGLAVKASQRPVGEVYEKLTFRNQGITDNGEELFVPADVNVAIKNLFGTGAVGETGVLTQNAFSKLLSTTTGLSKFVKVPLAPAAYSPQLFGNAFTMLGMGMNPFRGLKKGLGVSLAEFRKKGISLKEFNRYKALGLVDKDVRSSDIRASLENGYDIPILRGTVGEKAKGALRGIGKAYSAADTAFRISVFENYKKQLRKMSSNIEKKLSPEQFDRMAAELTNSTYQNYDRINPNLRFLSRIGVLNEFVSFNLELMRTTLNQAKLAKSMIDGSFARNMQQKYGVKIEAKAARREGMKRVTALSAALGAASSAIAIYNSRRGFDSEQQKAIRETVAPDWDDSTALIFSRDGDKIGLTNMSYRMPVAELTSAFEAGLRGEDLSESAGNFFQAVGDKMFGEGQMNMRNAINAIQNRDPDTGRPITSDPRFLDGIVDRATYYVGKTFKPGLINDIQKWDERTPSEQGARYLLGERKFNTTIDSGVGFKFRDIRDNVKSLRSGYSGSLFDENANVAAQYNKFNDVYRANMAEMVKHVNNLRTLGKSDEEIMALIKKGGASNVEVNATMRGLIPDMAIAVGVKGPTLDRVKRYADIYSRLPRELGNRMLEQEIGQKRINARSLNLIKQIVQLKAAQ